jgi:transposase
VELLARIRELEAQLADAAKRQSEHEAEIERLKALVETHQRAGKRQSAPFSKGPAKTKPARPGRKRGSAYGRKGRRRPPPAVDEVCEAKLPPSCPDCGGRVEKERDASQYQDDLPEPKPIRREFVVEIGNCVEPGCGVRVQGRHPLQTSDALGAAAAQLGPRVLAVIAKLRIDLGTSFGKIKRVMAEEFGISITRGGICQAVQRVGRKLEPSYDELRQQVQTAPYASLDETGWRVAARSAWLWVAATATTSFYAILPGRGFAQATALLDKAYRGFLGRDGWAAYRAFVEAIHQTCLPHLLRRCHKILETARGGEARFPEQVKALLQRALALRDRRDADDISPHGFAVARGKIIAAMTRLVAWKPEVEEVEANRKLAKHLRNELPALFTFLHHRGVAAANWLAEQELRIPIAIRKACGGGNRTWTGAKSFARIATVVRTARRRSLDPTAVIIGVLCSRRPVVARDLTAPELPAQPPADSEPRPPP